MNKIYRIVWSRIKNDFVVAHEFARGAGKSSTRRDVRQGPSRTGRSFAQHGAISSNLIAATILLATSTVGHAETPAPDALPADGRITSGSGSIRRSGADMTVQQNSDKMIANWRSFDIGSDASVTFRQPGADSVALNRVTGQDPSRIMGQLNANGRIMLVNPAGVMFGANSRVNVGGIVATTLDISDEDFLDGNYRFSNGGTAGDVENLGQILSDGGAVALVAPVTKNAGSIETPGGTTTMAAADEVTLDFTGDGLMSITVEKSALDALVENKGAIRASDGVVVLKADAKQELLSGAINNEGIVEARGLTRQGGRIVLGGSQVTNTGTVSAAGENGNDGGEIAIEGGFVALGGDIDADGANGGRIEVASQGNLSLADQVHARGTDGDGGTVSYSADGMLLENSGGSTDVSGSENGGAIEVDADRVYTSGSYRAEGERGQGGRIDITADQDVNLLSASLDASGATRGGLVRIGGAFQGGKTPSEDTPDRERFLDRWGTLPELGSAQETLINDSTGIDVSADAGDGGTAVVWSDQQTTMLGSIDASGQTGGGAVEISSAGELRRADLLNVNAGDGGSLLLDPKNLTIADAQTVTNWAYAAILGLGYSPSQLDSVDYISNGAVSLNDDGDRLAVGAYGDDGANNGVSRAGAVYLFSFTDTNFSGGTLDATLGSGYAGGNNLDVAALESGDQFGHSVSLNGAGDRLAVGAINDGGAANSGSSIGATYLFSFSDTRFSGGTQEARIGYGYSGSKDVDLTGTIESNDLFGRSVSLNSTGDRLAIGASGDDGSGNGVSVAGAVHLFTFTDDSFSGGTRAATIGTGYTNGKDIDLSSLSSNDRFGRGVSLNGTGDRLAVGAAGDNGAGDSVQNSGAVRLFSFTDNSFSGGVHEATLGAGYSSGKDVDVSNLETGDQFGYAVSLNNAGDRLAVGSRSDDGAGNSTSGAGAAYLFSFTDSNFSGGTLEATIGSGYSSGKNVDAGMLDAGDQFGIGISLNGTGDRLAVGAHADDGASNTTTGSGAVHLFSFTDDSFSGGALETSIGKGYAIDPATADRRVNVNINSDDRFGHDVALNNAGDRLAVGAPGDDGAGDISNNLGAVYLFSFTDTDYSGGTLESTIGSGYTGGKNVDMTTLSGFDSFGAAVSLNGSGDRLAVGAYQDDGATNGVSNAGAVYLFSFSDNSFSSGALEATLGSGYSSGKDVDLASLDSTDYFGHSVSLNDAGDRLAVGSVLDDGNANVATDRGAVYLFSFSDSSFSGGNLESIIGSGYTNTKDIDLNTLDEQDFFGYSVALNGAGDRLAIGANQDDGATDSANAAGAVYLYSFSDSVYSNGTLEAILGKGYTAGKNIDIPNLESNDLFGRGVSLNNAGDRLAVGAPHDKGASNGTINAGAVYLFDFQDTSFTSGQTTAILGSGYTDGQNLDIGGLESGDMFGQNVSLDGSGNRLAVGSYDEGINNSNTYAGAVYLFTGSDSLAPSDALTDGVYATLQGSDITITPSDIESQLDNGTTVTLQASNDITLDNALAVDNTGGDGGNLTLQAGRSLLLNADITTDNGNLSLFANDLASNGVIDADRDAGAASITMASGTRIDAGTGVVDIQLRDGTGKTNTSSGEISLRDISADTISVVNNGPTTGSGITLNGTLTAAATTGDGIVLAGDDFTNNTGASALSTAGSRWLVWSGSPAGDTRGGLSYNFKQYNASYGSTSVQGSGNGLLYTQAPTITASLTSTVSKTYDGTTDATLAAGNYTLSGEIDGDTVTLNNPASGTYDDKNAGIGKTVDVSGLSISSGSEGSASVYGYQLASTSVSGNVGEVTARTLNVSYGGVNKVYDGTTNASVTPGDDRVAGDTLSINRTASFADKNVGTGKSVNVSGASLSGTDAGNYTLASTTGSTTADITARTLTVNYSGVNKVYDGTTNASVTTGDDRVTGDTLSINRSASFADKNVGTGKSVNVSAASLSGTDAGNYTLASASGSTSAEITARTLTVNYSSVNKVYDGTTDASVTTGDDRVAGDTLSINRSASFADKNVGTGKSVSVSGASLSGTDAGNYTLASASGSTTADITAKSLNLLGLTAEDKTYDGTTDATISSYGSLSGVVGSDSVSLDSSNAAASFADPQPESDKTVTVSGLQLAGADLGNYAIGNQTTRADIIATSSGEDSATHSEKPPVIPSSAPGNSSSDNAGDRFNPPRLFGAILDAAGKINLSDEENAYSFSLDSESKRTSLTLGHRSGDAQYVSSVVSVPGSRTRGTLPLFRRTAGITTSAGRYQVVKTGGHWSSEPAGSAESSFPKINEVGMRVARVSLTLPNGSSIDLTVSVNQGGILLFKAPGSIRQVYNEQQIFLLAMSIAEQRFAVGSDEIIAAIYEFEKQ